MIATTTKDAWKDYFPSYVCLYYVDYRDNLDNQGELMEECIRCNSLYPISESIDDWWDTGSVVEEYIEEIKKAMERDGLEWDEHDHDEVQQAIWDADKSDPIPELVGNSYDLNAYYDLDYTASEPFGMADEDMEEEISEICSLLHILPGSESEKKIRVIWENANYGGRLRIYFPAGLMKLLSGEGWDEKRKDFKAIKFQGKFRVCIINLWNGSGYFEDDVELDVSFNFNRDCLGMSNEHYGFEEIFGDDCDIRNCECPQFLETANEQAITIGSEALTAQREREQKFQETFKAGKCTCGDNNMKRHRHVVYDNSGLCGWHCKDCGMFWVD